MHRNGCLALFCACLMVVTGQALADSAPAGFSLAQALDFPYPSELTAAPESSAIAWVENAGGARNIWVLDYPGANPRVLTKFLGDEGREITHLRFSNDGHYLVFVRGGDHDENWPLPNEPGADSMPAKPAREIWSIDLKLGAVTELGEGDEPAVAPDGSRVAFVHLPERSVWVSSLTEGKAVQLFFDRGQVSDLAWSPDGKALAFTSLRDDHGFIGVYRDAKTPIKYLSPSTSHDFMPRWSPDSKRIAFVRTPGDGGAPDPILRQVPQPWAIWVADVATGQGSAAWQSPDTLRGSYPQNQGEANLNWVAGDRLLFLAESDNWPHLYSVPASGGAATLLTPGEFMVEDVALSHDGSRVIYSANGGTTPGDGDRRHLHLLQLQADGGTAQTALTSGTDLEWTPVLSNDGKQLAFIQAGVQMPPLVMSGGMDTRIWRSVDREHVPADFPQSGFVSPIPVSFKAKDGLTVHAQLFAAPGATDKHPAVIFVHGGPPRQMLLGWHYMQYYANAYAVNQYLASHGFVVLSLNYRLGIGYGHDYNYPDHWGPTGAAEYQDVLAAAHFLQHDKRVDAKRLGIWGGSYGGYLTALALARDSAIFKAGVDFHGVHDWSYEISDLYTGGKPRYEQGDRKQAQKVAFESSPDASIKTWRSPVLLIQGDDDRNVYFHETVDLANRLTKQHVPYEELIIPNEVHMFLRHASWLAADQATVDFLTQQLVAPGH